MTTTNKVNPLFTDKEMKEWEDRENEAGKTRTTDKVGNNYNLTARQRLIEVEKSFELEKVRRIRKRHKEILDGLLTAMYEKGSAPIDWEKILTQGVEPSRLEKADVPWMRTRLHTVLSALKVVPRSWGATAVTRFLRGVGKQGKPPWSNKTGAGCMNKDWGWKQNEVTWFVGHFFPYYGELKNVFFCDDSPEAYGEEAEEIRNSGGDQFAATRNERDDDLLNALIKMLEERGLTTLKAPAPKKTKTRKKKVFKPGDTINQRNLRDVPIGATMRWTFTRYPYGAFSLKNAGTPFEVEIETYDMVLVGRERGMLKIRPVSDDVAYHAHDMRSSRIYSADSYQQEEQENKCKYLGQWDKEVSDIGLLTGRPSYCTGYVDKFSGWKKVSSKKEKRVYVRVEDNNGRYLRYEIRNEQGDVISIH